MVGPNSFLSANDVVLLVSLTYSCVDLYLEWGNFGQCQKPVHHWLLTSYACVVAFKIMHVLGSAAVQRSATAENLPGELFLLDMRAKGGLLKVLTGTMWSVALPFFAAVTLVGHVWLAQVWTQTPNCMPTTAHLWFAALWLALCYAWVVVHIALGAVAWVLENKVRAAERNLRAVGGTDMHDRWGPGAGRVAGFAELEGGAAFGRGLAPEVILALPSEPHTACSKGQLECSICIGNITTGERVRRLPACGHTYHTACIDLWLLRSAECPLCKRGVGGPPKV